MRTRRLSVWIGSALLTLPLTLVAGQAPALAHLNGCVTKANNPHVSRNSAGESLGIVAKSTIKCDHRHDSASLAIVVWKCSEDFGGAGRPRMKWIENHCDVRFGHVGEVEPVRAGKKYVRQAPERGGTRYRLRGWFVQDTTFFLFNNGNVDARRRISFVVFKDGRR